MTPLACSPILNLPLPRRATWFRDNRRIGSVNAASNLVLEGRAHFVESIPAVGLLLVPSVSLGRRRANTQTRNFIVFRARLDDEGDYYCALDDNSDARSTTYRLRVAYIWPFAASARPLVRVAHDTITIECPKARAWPQPLILWRVVSGGCPLLCHTRARIVHPLAYFLERRRNRLFKRPHRDHSKQFASYS